MQKALCVYKEKVGNWNACVCAALNRWLKRPACYHSIQNCGDVHAEVKSMQQGCSQGPQTEPGSY